MDLQLTDRVYIVTGASGGLGLATAAQLVADGAKVVVCSRDEHRIEAAARTLGDNAVAIAADLADEDTAERLVRAALDAFDRIDGAVLSVGGPPPGSVTTVSDDQWRDAFESVFLGPLRLARWLVAQQRPADHGEMALTFVLSTSVRSPITALGISNGLRPGLAMAVKALADEHAGRGIRFNAVLPGRIETARIQEIEAATGDPEKARTDALSTIPMGRIGQPEEFGRVAAFLTSPAASYVTGVAVPVDGGATRTI